MKHLYQIFGICLETPLEIPELDSAKSGRIPDLTIEFGQISRDLSDFHEHDLVLEPEIGRTRYAQPDLYRVLFEDFGKKVTLQLNQNIEPTEIIPHLLGTIMATFFHLRGQIALHASCVEHSSGGIILLGHRGAGKSTTAAALLKKGCRLVSDDLCVLDSNFRLMRGHRWQKLKADARLAYAKNAASRPLPTIDGEKMLVEASSQPTTARTIPRALILLRKAQAPEPEMVPLTGLEKINLLRRFRFRPRVAQEIGVHSGADQALLDFSGGIPVFASRRTPNESAEKLAQRILRLVSSLDEHEEFEH